MNDSTAYTIPSQPDFIVLPQPANEEWRPVIGYESEYAVSNLGRIKRLKESTARRRYPVGMILKPTLQKNGYTIIRLVDENGKRQALYMHRVVAIAFLGAIPTKHEVNHINRDRTDNRLENLEYLTRGKNNTHSYKEDGQGWVTSHVKNSMTDVQVREIKERYKNGESRSDIAKSLNSTYKIISNIVRGKTYRHVLDLEEILDANIKQKAS